MAYEEHELPIDKIHPSPLNPRETVTPVDLETIKRRGVVERITVRPHPTKRGEYEIVTGARRWLGAREAGLKKIPAKVEELTDAEVVEYQLIENLQREDLTPIEEGKVFRKLNKELGYSQEEIGRRIGKPKMYVTERFNLVEKLAPEVQKEVIESYRAAIKPGEVRPDEAYSIGVSKAIELARLPEPEQKELAERIRTRGMYVADLRGTIRRGKEIEKIISEVKRPELREELAKKYLKLKYDSAIKPSQVLVDIQRAKGLPVETPEDIWKRMMTPLNRVYNMFPRNSFVRDWKLGDRQYATLVMWMDIGEKIPELVREDFPKEKFRDFMEADRYAAEHGGYCSGLVTLMGREYWCIFVKEKKKAG